MTERRVDLLRVAKDEEVYDVEEVLGRDARSVFPNQSKAAAAADAAADNGSSAVAEMLGAKRFVTESELQAIKASRGETEQLEPLKPLAEVLREAKQAKESAFADKWKQMKTGKNRPLDESELEFLDSVAEAEAARIREQMASERQEIAEFRRAAAEAAASDVHGLSGPKPASSQPTVKLDVVKPAVKPLIRVVKVKSKAQDTEASPGTAQGFNLPASNQRQSTHAEDDVLPNEMFPAAKKTRTESAVVSLVSEQDKPSLAGLLGGYGSDSEDEG